MNFAKDCYRECNILLRMTAALAIGLAAFGVATAHAVLWIAISTAIPALLLIYHFTVKRIFIDILTQRKLALIKYITFAVQNAVILFAYRYLDEATFSLVCLWIFRINVFEVMLDLALNKEFALCIPALFLITSPLHFVKDPRFIMWMNEGGIYFVIDYTLWFIAWITVRFQDRSMLLIHTLYPVFFPPQLWFSVRTLTGMVTLVYSYIAPVARNVMESGTSQTDVVSFGKIYKQVYLFVWPALLLYRFLYL